MTIKNVTHRGRVASIPDDLIISLWHNLDVSLDKAAAALGVTRQAIKWRANRLKLPDRLVMRRNRRVSDKVFTDMWSAGVKKTDIKEVCGYTCRARVDQRRMFLGLPARTRPEGTAKGTGNAWGAISIDQYKETSFKRLMEQHIADQMAGDQA